MMLPSLLDRWLRSLLKHNGYVFMRKKNPHYYLGRRMMLMRNYGIDLVLDVGANSGQYAKQLRSLGYSEQIISFEPMKRPFLELKSAADKDARWSSIKCGLGDADTSATIHVSENSISSSILPSLTDLDVHSPTARFIGNENIELRRLDTLYADQSLANYKSIWIKIDVQGYEHKVLAGATTMLPSVAAIQLELSLIPLYSDQLTIIPMLELLADAGFDPVAFEPGFEDKASGEYLQVDGVFRNRHMKAASVDARH